MAYDATGKIYIPMEEFWAFVTQFHPKFEGNIHYGKVVQTECDLEIEYATGSEVDPADWAVPPDFMKAKK